MKQIKGPTKSGTSILHNQACRCIFRVMSIFNDDQGCFVCGQGNPAGLRLQFRETEPGLAVEAEVVFPASLQGWQDTVHGGLLATVLDESMVKAAAAAVLKCVTGEITVKFRIPAATGAPCLAAGRILQTRGRISLAEGQIRDASGKVLAQATGKLVRID